MFPSGPRYIVITKRLALREGYDSPSPSPLSPSSSAEYQYDTLLYFWFLFESFLFPSLTFPRNRRCSSSLLSLFHFLFFFFTMYSFVYVDIFGLDLQLQSDFVNHLYKRKFIEKEIYFFFKRIFF